MKKVNFASILRRQDNYFIAYLIFIALLTAYYLFQLPIFAGDTDLWYHLNGGRYIFENKSIPKDSFFSFIDPPREWVDYFWLFQVLVFKIYSFSDYYGLVFLRALIFFAIIFVVASYFLHKSHDKRPYLYAATLVPLYILFLLPRYQLVRPHILTYLFIAVFLYIIEFKKKKVIYLPALAVIWMNVHGITYPIMLLIILAYLVEFFISHIKDKTRIEKNELYFIIPLIVCIAAVYCTPHGSKLTWMPFIPTGFASLYIVELGPMKWDHFLTFQIKTMIGSKITVFNLLFVISCLALIRHIFHQQKRLSHLLLFAGGIILLTKGIRFMYEFALLAIPVIKGGMLSAQHGSVKSKTLKPVQITLLFLFIVATIYNIQSSFQGMPRFPFSYRNLPAGVVTFLKTTKTGGSILNHPDTGGYLQWMLYPKYKIFMDMEVPFLFTNDDVYIAKSLFYNEIILNKVVMQYNPLFITASINDPQFKDLMKSLPEYRIVFFDDHEVLFANKRHLPEIVEAYELKIIDPYILKHETSQFLGIIKEKPLLLQELLRINAVFNGSILVNQCIATLYIQKGEFDSALPYADAIVENYPELVTGYKLRGDIFQSLTMYDKALISYSEAIKRLNAVEIHKEIGFVYLKQHKYAKAYNTLVHALNLYSPTTTYKDMYFLIFSAIKANKNREAKILYEYIYKGVPPGDKEWYKKYQELQTKIQEPGARTQEPE